MFHIACSIDTHCRMIVCAGQILEDVEKLTPPGGYNPPTLVLQAHRLGKFDLRNRYPYKKGFGFRETIQCMKLTSIDMSPVSFKGKVVLVTGAGSVIGAEVAHHFSKLGGTLVLTDSDKGRLNKVNEDCGGNCLLIAAELTKNEDIESVFKQTIEKLKKLDVLVNYAGTGENSDNDAPSLEHYDQTMNINVRVVYQVTMLATPHLIKTKGNIVNVAGLSSGRTSHVLSNSVSRSALEQLTKCVALQLAAEGVRVNAVSPDMIETNLNAGERKSNGSNKKLERTGSPKDVADAVVFLASECAGFISGANLPVDGGKHLACIVDDIIGDMQRKEATQKKSLEQPQTQKGEANKLEVHKGEPAHKQDGKGTPTQKQDSKGEQGKRDVPKEESMKPSSTKQDTTSQDKSSPKQDLDKNQQAKPGKHGH